jgi:hypothetical protein
MEQENPLLNWRIDYRKKEVFDPLTGRSVGYRGDSDAGLAAELTMNRPWTIDEIINRAKRLGKEFNPSPDIAGSLEKDLADGALVLFTELNVNTAAALGKIPEEWTDDLLNLVTQENDIAVIPVRTIEKWKEQQLNGQILFQKDS